MKNEASVTLDFLQQSVKEIEDLEGDLVKQVKVFNEKMSSATNEDQKELLQRQFASITALRKEYGEEASQQVATYLQDAGIADLKNMQKAMSTFGKDLPDVLEKVAKRVEDIKTDKRVSPDTAISMA